MILPIGEAKLNSAFTLIEILLVVVILGIVLALAAPNFSKEYSRFQLNKTTDDLLNVSRWAQAMAIGHERIYALNFSGDHHSYNLMRANEQNDFEAVKGALGQMHTVPDDIHLETSGDRIEFYPDGTIDPATIQVASSKQKTVLSSTEMRGMMTKVNND